MSTPKQPPGDSGSKTNPSSPRLELAPSQAQQQIEAKKRHQNKDAGDLRGKYTVEKEDDYG
jgi:hypothetical protein